jgi:putative glutamine amidotransferase
MRPRIAIPIPHSGNAEYAGRALPQYEQAVSQAGGDPVRIPLDQTQSEAKRLIESCDGVLLPGSEADVDPAKYNAARHPKTATPDVKRYVVDELLLEDAYKMRKPVFGICYGLQILNVHCAGSLVQHIESQINHEAGRKVPIAHDVSVEEKSLLGEIVAAAGGNLARLPVNSSHHQSADVAGDGLRIVSRSTEDGIVEAVEGTSPDHFVLAVQWHPERSVDLDESSRALFQAFVKAAEVRREELATKTVSR